MATLIDPTTHRTLHINNLSKRQLAQLVNESSGRIRALEETTSAVWRMLIAIAREPEAFQVAGGHVTIDQAAIDRVQKGTRLTCTPNASTVVLTVEAPTDATRVELARQLP